LLSGFIISLIPLILFAENQYIIRQHTQIRGNLEVIGNIKGNAYSLSDGTPLIDQTSLDTQIIQLKQDILSDTEVQKGVEAYGWGNHASAGYLKNINNCYIGELKDVDTTTVETGYVLKYAPDFKWRPAVDEDTKYFAGDGLSLTETIFSNADKGSTAVSLHEGTYNHTDIQKGVTAYGWGNHADEGYLKDITNFSINDLKDVDLTDVETGIDYTLYYDATAGKWKIKELVIPPNKKIISFPYKLWREALNIAFTGYTDVQLQVSTNRGFTEIVKDVNSNSDDRTDFSYFSATTGTDEVWTETGIPATDILDIIYTGDLTFTSDVFLRWRMIEHGTTNYGEWLPGGIMK